MAAENDKKFRLKTEVLSDGHKVQYDFAVDKLSQVESWTLNQEYNTRCENIPTSWIFGVIFRPISANGIVNIPVTLERCDNRIFDPVDVSIRVLLSNTRGENFFDSPANFICPRMAHGEEIQESITGILQSLELITLFNRKVNVRAVLEIRSCHAVINVCPEGVFSTGNKLITE